MTAKKTTTKKKEAPKPTEKVEETKPKVEEVAPKPTEKLDLNKLGSKKVVFVSNGSNPKLGKEGTEKTTSERNAALFTRNGWGEVTK